MPIPMVANYGRIVVLKRTGQDSASFDLTDESYLFGRGAHCDIRIQLATIAEEHCRVYRNAGGQAVVENIGMQGTIVNGITLTKGDSQILKSGDIMTVVERSFRFECDTPLIERVEPEADMIHFTPAKVEAASLGEEGQRTPSRQAPGTPTKTSLLTPSKAGGTPARRTPIKPTGSATPVKATNTPGKASTEGKLIMTSGIVGSPMRTMKLMGSPMRVSTPVKSEQQITEVVNDFVSGSAKGTPRRLSKHQQEQEQQQAQEQSLFEVTPVKQIEPAPSSTPREGSTVSKFNVSEIPPPTTIVTATTPGPSSKHLTEDSPGPRDTPKAASPTNGNDGQPTSQVMGLVTPPPPSRHSLGGSNINLLFPPTPALAAASKLAESIAVAGGSSTGGETPSVKGTPMVQSLRGTPPITQVTAVTPTLREGTINEEVITDLVMEEEGGTPLPQRLRSPRKGTPTAKVANESPRLGGASTISASPRSRMMTNSPRSGSSGSTSQSVVPTAAAISPASAKGAISMGSPTAAPGTPSFSVKGTPSKANISTGEDTPFKATTKNDAGEEVTSVQGTPMAAVIVKETPPTVGTPLMAIGLASSAGGSTSNTPIKASRQQTPGRSPRFSVASGGSPVVLDKEITGSPKLTRVDFYFEPAVAAVTNGDDHDDADIINGEGGEGGDDQTIVQMHVDDEIRCADDRDVGFIPDDTAVTIDNPNCEKGRVSLVEANFPGVAEGEGGEGQSAEPVKVGDQMQIDTNEPGELEQGQETDKVPLIDGGGQVAGDAVEVAPTASSMETISTTTAATTAVSGDLLTSTVISCGELISMGPVALEGGEASVTFEEIGETFEVALKAEGEEKGLAKEPGKTEVDRQKNKEEEEEEEKEKEKEEEEKEKEEKGRKQSQGKKEETEVKVGESRSTKEKGGEEKEVPTLGHLVTKSSPVREATSSQSVTSNASSAPSTPRRSTRLAAATTKTPAAIVNKGTPATTGKRRTPAPSLGKGRTPLTTSKKTPAPKRMTHTREEREGEGDEEGEGEGEKEEKNTHEPHESATVVPTPATRSRTPRATRPKTSTMKTPATEPKSRMAASSAKRSVRKAPATSKASMTGASGRKLGSARRQEHNHETAEDVDATSPSLNSRAARTRRKQVKEAEERPHMNGGDNENIKASTNVTIMTATVRKTPSAKRTFEEVDNQESMTNEDDDDGEGDAAGRRRSTRARTPAKAH